MSARSSSSVRPSPAVRTMYPPGMPVRLACSTRFRRKRSSSEGILHERAGLPLAVQWGGTLFENGNAAVVICQQAFDPFQATLDRIESFVHRVAQVVDALALVQGGDGEGDDDGQSDLNERLLPPVHMSIVDSSSLGVQCPRGKMLSPITPPS